MIILQEYGYKQSNRGKWDGNKMKKAIVCVMEGKLTVRLAARKYDVPLSTVQDRVKALKRGQKMIFKPKLGRFDSTFDENFSLQLCNDTRGLDNCLMPLTSLEFLKLVFKISHRFNKEKRMAGKDFFMALREIPRAYSENF